MSLIARTCALCIVMEYSSCVLWCFVNYVVRFVVFGYDCFVLGCTDYFVIEYKKDIQCIGLMSMLWDRTMIGLLVTLWQCHCDVVRPITQCFPKQ